MPVYDFDMFRDLKVYNVNVRNNKQCLVLFSGSHYPSFNKQLYPICDHMTLYYADVWDVYVVTSEHDYLRLYYDNVIGEYIQMLNKPVTCLCFCISASFISNVIYKLNRGRLANRVSLISYESSFDNYEHVKLKPYIGVTINKQYLSGDKRAGISMAGYFHSRTLIDDVISYAMKKHNVAR